MSKSPTKSELASMKAMDKLAMAIKHYMEKTKEYLIEERELCKESPDMYKVSTAIICYITNELDRIDLVVDKCKRECK